MHLTAIQGNGSRLLQLAVLALFQSEITPKLYQAWQHKLGNICNCLEAVIIQSPNLFPQLKSEPLVSLLSVMSDQVWSSFFPSNQLSNSDDPLIWAPSTKLPSLLIPWVGSRRFAALERALQVRPKDICESAPLVAMPFVAQLIPLGETLLVIEAMAAQVSNVGDALLALTTLHQLLIRDPSLCQKPEFQAILDRAKLLQHVQLGVIASRISRGQVCVHKEPSPRIMNPLLAQIHRVPHAYLLVFQGEVHVNYGSKHECFYALLRTLILDTLHLTCH